MKYFTFTLFCIFAGYGSTVLAVPVNLTGQYTINGGANVVDAGGNSFDDSFSDSTTSPPLLNTTAVLSPTGSAASAYAAADSGRLLVITDTSSTAEFATAVAVTTFTGDFIGTGQAMALRLNITNDALLSGVDSLLQALLNITLVGAGNLLFNETFALGATDRGEQSWVGNFYLPTGAAGLLDISLSSQSGSFSGSASNAFSVTFDLAAVPEPLVVLNLLLGLAVITLIRPKQMFRNAKKRAFAASNVASAPYMKLL